mgnify:CR=1 FL=1
MYACESIWFQKEERRKTLYKTIGNYAGIGFLILLILAFVFFLIGGFFSKVPENHTLLQEETINQTMNNAENIKNTLPSDNKTSENGSGELMEESLEILNEFVLYLKSNRFRIEIFAPKNQAEYIAEYIIKSGVRKDRIAVSKQSSEKVGYRLQ